jgi:hypothetical protein
MTLNIAGTIINSIVMVIFLVTKFTHGAWIIVLLIPTLVWVFTRIHNHYMGVAQILSTAGQHVSAERRTVQAIVLVGDVHRETLKLVEFAHSLGVPWRAVHIAVNEERVADIQKKWQERVGLGELVIVRSPFRSLTRPLRSYVEKLLKQTNGGYVQVIMGELRTGNPATQALHQNAHIIQRLALNDLPGVVATIVPFQLESYRENGENGNGGAHHTTTGVPATSLQPADHGESTAAGSEVDAVAAAIYEGDSVTRSVASFPDNSNVFRRGNPVATSAPTVTASSQPQKSEGAPSETPARNSTNSTDKEG